MAQAGIESARPALLALAPCNSRLAAFGTVMAPRACTPVRAVDDGRAQLFTARLTVYQFDPTSRYAHLDRYTRSAMAAEAQREIITA